MEIRRINVSGVPMVEHSQLNLKTMDIEVRWDHEDYHVTDKKQFFVLGASNELQEWLEGARIRAAEQIINIKNRERAK